MVFPPPDGLARMGEVDAVVACTHSSRVRLTAQMIRRGSIRRKGKRLLVVDVAEPANPRRQYNPCRDICIRQDAGNAYSRSLRYVLGAISHRLFRLSRGVTFGCFAESLALSAGLADGNDWIRDIDWFQVSEVNMERVASLFDRYGLEVPSPRCFGKPVRSYILSPESERSHQSELVFSKKMTDGTDVEDQIASYI